MPKKRRLKKPAPECDVGADIEIALPAGQTGLAEKILLMGYFIMSPYQV